MHTYVRGGEVERWRGGEVERWRGGEVERWRGGEVERWRGGSPLLLPPTSMPFDCGKYHPQMRTYIRGEKGVRGRERKRRGL